jgi:uncharacterized protein YjbI with pentapeptide repeats
LPVSEPQQEKADTGGDSTRHNPWTTRAAVIAGIATAIATLIASIGGLYYNGQASRQATEQARQATRQAHQQQMAQTSERFSRSVEQLGSESLPVRIGALYSFSRLMRDSKVDQQVIVEILSSFIRLQAREAAANDQKMRLPPTDILAALHVLYEQPLPRLSMRLAFVNLSGYDLSYTGWREAYLVGAHLTGTKLKHADLTDANLDGAHLNGADLTGAHLNGVHLNGAHLNGADLSYADLTGAHLNGAHMRHADLTDATLIEVDCSPLTQWPKDVTQHPDCWTH